MLIERGESTRHSDCQYFQINDLFMIHRDANFVIHLYRKQTVAFTHLYTLFLLTFDYHFLKKKNKYYFQMYKHV